MLDCHAALMCIFRNSGVSCSFFVLDLFCVMEFMCYLCGVVFEVRICSSYLKSVVSYKVGVWMQRE